MFRKFTAILAALALSAASLTPSVAEARDRHGGYYNGHGYGGGRYWRGHRGNDGDAVAAGVVGLVLGLALGAAASQPRAPRYGSSCTDNYQRCAPPPPPPCYQPCGGPPPGYYNQGYYEPRYDDRRADYDREYGLEGGYGPPPYAERSGCMHAERQWDRYAQRYVTVDVPC